MFLVYVVSEFCIFFMTSKDWGKKGERKENRQERDQKQTGTFREDVARTSAVEAASAGTSSGVPSASIESTRPLSSSAERPVISETETEEWERGK